MEGYATYDTQEEALERIKAYFREMSENAEDYIVIATIGVPRGRGRPEIGLISCDPLLSRQLPTVLETAIIELLEPEPPQGPRRLGY